VLTADIARTVRVAGSRANLRLRSGFARNAASLFESFESFGDNCEFGFVQRDFGARTIGLFKFAGTSIDSLVRVLQTRFAPLRSPARIDLTVQLNRYPNGRVAEYVVTLGAYGIAYHAGVTEKEASLEEVRSNQIKRVALLSRKMSEDLEEGGKIFVFKSQQTETRARIDQLVSHMRSYGRAPLLWVTSPEKDRPPGHVEELDDGLLRGYIDRFAPDNAAGHFSPSFWPIICGKAQRLWIPRMAEKRAT
jgi:hypothetical protein